MQACQTDGNFLILSVAQLIKKQSIHRIQNIYKSYDYLLMFLRLAALGHLSNEQRKIISFIWPSVWVLHACGSSPQFVVRDEITIEILSLS